MRSDREKSGYLLYFDPFPLEHSHRKVRRFVSHVCQIPSFPSPLFFSSPPSFSFDPSLFLSFFLTTFVCLYTSDGDECIKERLELLDTSVSTSNVHSHFPEFFHKCSLFIFHIFYLSIARFTTSCNEFNLSLISINHIPPRVSS